MLADLASAARTLNIELATNNPSCMFVTFLLAVFDPRTGGLDYVCCGHVPPYLRRPNGMIERLNVAGGLPLGVSETTRYKAGHVTLQPG